MSLGYRPRMIDTTPVSKRGTLMVNGGSLISWLKRFGFIGPKNVLLVPRNV